MLICNRIVFFGEQVECRFEEMSFIYFLKFDKKTNK